MTKRIQRTPAGRVAGADVGNVRSVTKTITQNSTTAVTVTFPLPKNAKIIDIIADVKTAYNSASSATLTVGTAAAGTQYAGSVDAKTAGRTRPTFSAAQLDAMDDIGANTTVYATITVSGATSAGTVDVTLLYAAQ